MITSAGTSALLNVEGFFVAVSVTVHEFPLVA